MSRPLIDVLNEGNQNKLGSAAQAVELGNALGLVTRFIKAPVVADVIALPDGFKAASIVRAFATAGGTTGMKTPVLPEGAVAATQVGTTPTGDILFAAADAVTSAEVEYAVLEDGGVFEEDIDVVASALVFPQGRGAVVLLAASVLVGLVLGAKVIEARGAAPAAGDAALATDGLGVTFNVADVVNGKAHVKYAAAPGVGPGSELSLAARLASDVAL